MNWPATTIFDEAVGTAVCGKDPTRTHPAAPNSPYQRRRVGAQSRQLTARLTVKPTGSSFGARSRRL